MRTVHDLTAVPLFRGIEAGELDSLLGCLNATFRSFSAKSVVFSAGDPAGSVGIVRSGAIRIEREDFFGNRTILAKPGAGDIFGEAFACAGIPALPVSVVAAEACSVVLIDYRKIITTCPSSCSFHSRLIENMLRILAQKNMFLNHKNELLSCRTTRAKLLRYLGECAERENGLHFTIPFNRQELADYLCVDRSALSSELGRMRDDGVLSFDKNSFTLSERPEHE